MMKKRRIFPNYGLYTATTQLRVEALDSSITLSITSRANKRQRRALALALLRDFRHHFSEITFTELRFTDHAVMPDHNRRPHVDNSAPPTLQTPQGRFGFLVRVRRLALGMTQLELAKIVRMERTHLSRLERGQFRPNELTQAKLACFLDITLPRVRPAYLVKKSHIRTLKDATGGGVFGPGSASN
jgi:DNA-binding XRE family transcriptional regulator